MHGKSGLGSDHGRVSGEKFKPTELMFFRNEKLRVTQISCGQNHSLAIAHETKRSKIKP